MTTLILMRHGETVPNTLQVYQGQGDGELSKLGIQQAKIAANYFSGVHIDHIYSSDLKRAADTSDIIAEKHGINVVRTHKLKERFYGDWEGLTFRQIQRKYGILYKKWLVDPGKARIPFAETLSGLQQRGVEAVDEIMANHRNRTVLIVAHGGINRAILFHFMGLDLNNFWRIRQNNCCMNVVEFKPPYPRVVVINNTCYLSDMCRRHKFKTKELLKKKDVLA